MKKSLTLLFAILVVAAAGGLAMHSLFPEKFASLVKTAGLDTEASSGQTAGTQPVSKTN